MKEKIDFIKDEDFHDEMVLLSNEFLNKEIFPRKYQFLFKNFKTKKEIIFVCYYLYFGKTTSIMRHTGYKYSGHQSGYIKKKIDLMLDVYNDAKYNFNMEVVASIERGDYNFYVSEEYRQAFKEYNKKVLDQKFNKNVINKEEIKRFKFHKKKKEDIGFKDSDEFGISFFKRMMG